MPEVASKPIEPPADQYIELTPSSRPQEIVEGGPTILGTAHAPIDVFEGRPLAC